MNRNKIEEQAEYLNFNLNIDIPFLPVNNPEFKFIDLFAGIGGFRIAMQNLGGECVFSSEVDKFAKQTYDLNFGEIPFRDITKINENDIPEHDILCAGFPCQPFSIAGKRNGFKDTRGTLFFDVQRIIKAKKPKAFFLENVRGLKSHDKGKTFEVIKNTLEELGYSFYFKIIKASDHGLPQHRPRLFMIGFREDIKADDFSFPKKEPLNLTMSDILGVKCDRDIGFTVRASGRGSGVTDKRNWDAYRVDNKYYYNENPLYEKLSKEIIKKNVTYQWRRTYVRENKGGVCPTLTANMGTGGHNVPILKDTKGIRKLTPRECARLQGFPDNFLIKVSDSQAYKQFGNSVAIPAIQATAKKLIKKIKVTGEGYD